MTRLGAILLATLLLTACHASGDPADMPADASFMSGEDASTHDMLAADMRQELDQSDAIEDAAGDLEDAREDARVLSLERMTRGRSDLSGDPLDLEAFAARGALDVPPSPLVGRLVLSSASARSRIFRDDFQYTRDESLGHVPDLEISLTSRVEDGLLLPAWRGLRVGNAQAAWWVIVGEGEIWKDARDQGASRALLPFSLVQPHTNCTLHGTMTFLYGADGPSSDAYYQISQETCLYLEVDMWGWLDVQRAESGEEVASGDLLAARDARRGERLPEQPLAALAAQGIDSSLIGSELTPRHVTTLGVIFDGVHYRGECATRAGQMPRCQEVPLPSYSTAKSAVAGVAYMALAKQRGLLATESLGDNLLDLPPSWEDVTLGALLDMTSGHFDSTEYMLDEDGARMLDFFLTTDDAARTNLALSFSPQETAPWVYHSSDTFLATKLMQRWLGEDLFGWLVSRIWEPLGLSDVARAGLRVEGGSRQHFGSHGSWWLPSDIALVAQLLQDHASGARDDLLDGQEVARALGRAPENDAPFTRASISETLSYYRGFWALEVGATEGFACTRQIAFMSGYGGISVVMLPNGVTYYYFGDGAEFAWLDTARELAKLGDFCD